MASEDVLLLCEYVIETQLGQDILQPIGKILIRGGAQSLSNLVDRTGSSQEHVVNVLTVLLKHNLLHAVLNTYKNVHYYNFRHQECLLRVSFPRYLLWAKNNVSGGAASGVKPLVKMAILKEVFLAGSLLKSEIAQILARQTNRNATILK